MDNCTKKITIYDIAQEAGVSASQVSRAISGNGYVSRENREKIQEIVEKYNYKPSAMARNLQKGKTNMLGFVIPHIMAEYFSSTYYEFEREMTEKGYITIVFNGKSTWQEEKRILQLLEEIRVDAVVVMGGSLDAVDWNPEYVRMLQNLNSKIPCVLCSERADKLDCAGVYTNIEVGISALIEHLAEEGYKTLGVLGGLKTVYPSVRVQKVIQECAREYGIEVKPEWCVDSSYNEQDGAEAMRELLKCGELPAAVCCINDNVAIGAMGVALDAGLKIPEDMAFAGYDGIHMSRIFRPQLTTVQMDFHTMGHKLVEAVENSLAGKKEPHITLVDPWLEIRESTKK